MSKPQQPELRRSGRGATDDDSAKVKADQAASDGGQQGWIPPDNRPATIRSTSRTSLS